MRAPARPRLPWSNPSYTIGAVVALVIALALVGIALVVGPFGADGDTAAGGGPRSTGLRAQTQRSGDGTQVSVTGRVRPTDGRGPAKIHVLGRRDDPRVCPMPRVAGDGTITPAAGSVPIRWDGDIGPAPGATLPAGQPIRMVGTIAHDGPAIRRLCVHLAIGGATPAVLRSVDVAMPDVSASDGPGVNTPLEEDALVLALLSVIVVAMVLGILAIGVVEARRRGRTWSLPAFPADMRVPDVVPAEDPRKGASRRRHLVRTIGERRLATWRGKRKARAADAGEVFDPHERPPWHVAIWGVGDGGGRIAVERFKALRDLYPAVEALHLRRVPGPRGATIDHLFVGPAGVVVVSSSRWDGFVEVRGDRLVVDGKDRTRALEGVAGRVTAVRAIMGMAGFAGLPVVGILHCVETEDVLLDGSLVAREIPLLDALGTMGRAVDGDVLGTEDVRRLVVALERRLPPAV